MLVGFSNEKLIPVFNASSALCKSSTLYLMPWYFFFSFVFPFVLLFFCINEGEARYVKLKLHLVYLLLFRQEGCFT